MRRWFLAALLLGACAQDTAIVLEVKWADEVRGDATTLHIFVGTETADAAVFVTNGATTSLDIPVSPYRHALRPGAELDRIGAIQLAAALTKEDGKPVAFAAAPAPIAFADGEIRTITIELEPRPFVLSGDGACVTWSSTDGRPDQGIGAAGDTDCDRAGNATDCQPFDPAIDDGLADSDDFGCDDCLDGDAMVDLGGFSIDPGTVFPGQNEDEFRQDNNIPDTVTCIHIDFDCDGHCGDPNAPDPDGSGSDACGLVDFGPMPGVCPTRPADCIEGMTGINNPLFGDGEACNGQDDSCDGEMEPPLPCLQPGPAPDTCMVGVNDCNDDIGVYQGCRGSGFDVPLPPEACEAMSRLAECEGLVDPLSCVSGARDRCIVGFGSPGCVRERLALPGAPGVFGCDWRVIGGIAQAEWRIGFTVTPDNAAPLAEATQACAPFLVAHPIHPQPAPRTVMVVGRSAPGDVPHVRFIRFEGVTEQSACNGVLECAIILPG